VRSLHHEDEEIAVWWGSRLECISALMRLVREGRLDAYQEVQVRACLADLFEAAAEVEPTEDVRDRAERLLALHPLRAADALQLAAALVWARERPIGRGFVCLDQRLRQAAGREGFGVLPPIVT
jgi:predicted nucleic acid-binding protein